MKRTIILLTFILLSVSLNAQDSIIPVPVNMIAEDVPPLSVNIANEVKNYTESRSSSFVTWHPVRKEMLISKRFENTSQLHNVKFAEADPEQITFFDEPVRYASYEPVKGDYFLFYKDIGGNEFSQIYRYDISYKTVTLLTDGKRSQNTGIRWNNRKYKIAYSSTKRNGKDRDFYILDPLDPNSEKIVSENSGGGWSIADWSEDDSKLLVREGISVNESRVYLLDINTGIKSRLLPETDERTTYIGISFSKDGKGIYLITNKDSEFNRLAYYDPAAKTMNYLTSDIPWNVDDAELSEDGTQVAFETNENGLSKLYMLSTASNKYSPVPNLPAGVMGGMDWSPDSKSIGFTFGTYNSSAIAYEFNTITNELIRWTKSETGGMDLTTLQEPELISWKSFDGLQISGYLYKASSKFRGKRPVIIDIHGGPEGQSRPVFLGRNNYYLNELGIAIIYPNVRGSSGYGKTFLDLDNGLKREESVKDIGALFDWIEQQHELDADRIMVTGGSYGGYMTLAVSYLYSEKIRCAVDVVGVSNYNTFMKNTEDYRRDLRRVEYGDERDPEIAAFFEAIAPLNHADKITKPILIVQGGNDPRVPYTEAIQMKEKITQNGGTVWFLMANDEGHGFSKKINADFQFHATVEFVKKFLIN